jgi:AcrR family transcriptional regulator
MQAREAPEHRILDAAMRVFRRHGFRRSTIEQAAEEAGLTRQALYHHFSSKEALFRGAIARFYERALAAETEAARAAEEAGRDLADVVIAEVTARLGVLLTELQGSPHLDELLSEHLAQSRDLYQTYFARFGEEVAATIARVCRTRKLKLARGVTVEEVARCVEMAIHGIKSAYPSMQPVDAFLKQLAVMLRMLIAGALAQPQASKSSRETGDRK